VTPPEGTEFGHLAHWPRGTEGATARQPPEPDAQSSPQEPSATLDAISGRFQDAFPEQARFRGCCALVILLRDFLLTLPQRLSVYFLLFDVYRRHRLGTNPFMPVFINAVRAGSGVAKAERSFAQQLLMSAPTDKAVGQRSPESFVEELSSRAGATKTPDLSAMVHEFEKSLPAVPLLLRAERGPVVIDAAGADARAKGRRAVAHALSLDSASAADAGAAAAARGSMATQGAEAAASASDVPLGIDDLPQLQASSVAASLRLPITPGESARAEGTETGARSALSVSAALASIADQEAEAGARAEAGSQWGAASASAAGPQGLAPSSDPAAALRGGVARVPPALMAAAALDTPDPASLGSEDLFRLGGFQPVFARPPPPLVGLGVDELVWLDAAEAPPLLWETGMGEAGASSREVRELMARATSDPLNEAALGRIRLLLSAGPRAVFESGLSPTTLPALVMKNALVAVECLKLLKGSAQIDE